MQGSIPGRMAASCPTPVGQQAEVVLFEILRPIPGQRGVLRVPGQLKILFIPGHSMILFIPGGVPLLTPASVGRRALRRPIHACRAIATAFA